MSRPCPCQSKKTYDLCCQQLHTGKRVAKTASELMRSRYSAYAEAKVDYLIKTTATAEREKIDRADLLDYCKNLSCVGLKIVSAERGGPEDQDGTVLFHASLQMNGRRIFHRELSRFVREDGEWRYVDGETN